MLALFSAVIIVLLVTGMLHGRRDGAVGDPRRGLVLLGHVVEHFCAGDRGPRRAEEPGIVAARDGDPRRRAAAAAPGGIADRLGIQISFIVRRVRFAYVAFYGVYGYRAGRRLGGKGRVTADGPRHALTIRAWC